MVDILSFMLLYTPLQVTGFPSWFPEHTRPVDLCFQGTSWEKPYNLRHNICGEHLQR